MEIFASNRIETNIEKSTFKIPGPDIILNQMLSLLSVIIAFIPTGTFPSQHTVKCSKNAPNKHGLPRETKLPLRPKCRPASRSSPLKTSDIPIWLMSGT